MSTHGHRRKMLSPATFLRKTTTLKKFYRLVLVASRTVITICHQHQNISQNVLLLFRRPFCSKGQGYFGKVSSFVRFSLACRIDSPHSGREVGNGWSEKANFPYLGTIEQATRVVTGSDCENKAPFFVGKTILGWYFHGLSTIA